jgi:hypothetical protein
MIMDVIFCEHCNELSGSVKLATFVVSFTMLLRHGVVTSAINCKSNSFVISYMWLHLVLEVKVSEFRGRSTVVIMSASYARVPGLLSWMEVIVIFLSASRVVVLGMYLKVGQYRFHPHFKFLIDKHSPHSTLYIQCSKRNALSKPRNGNFKSGHDRFSPTPYQIFTHHFIRGCVTYVAGETLLNNPNSKGINLCAPSITHPSARRYT